MRMALPALIILLCQAVATTAEPIHVLVWDERQPDQSKAYENFLGNEIAQNMFVLCRDWVRIVIQLTIGGDAATDASKQNDCDRPTPN